MARYLGRLSCLFPLLAGLYGYVLDQQSGYRIIRAVCGSFRIKRIWSAMVHCGGSHNGVGIYTAILVQVLLPGGGLLSAGLSD